MEPKEYQKSPSGICLERQEIVALVEREARDILDKAGVHCPPVDAYLITSKLGLTIQIDPFLNTRGYSKRRWDRGTIIIGSKNPNKSERKQFTIAHEIGEMLLKGKVEQAYLEKACNILALNLLLPKEWFKRDAKASNFDLFELKKIYSTASHELIAFRMLEFRPMIITIFDNGKLYRREYSYSFPIKTACRLEMKCLKDVTTCGKEIFLEDQAMSVIGWPVFREDWKRVILKTEFNEAPTDCY